MAPPDLRTDPHTLPAPRPGEVDLGLAGRRPFLREASLGLAVGVTDRLTPRLQRRLGPLARPVATMRAYRTAVPFGVRLEFPDGDHERLDVADVLQMTVRPGLGVLDLHLVGNAPLRDQLAINRRLRRGEPVQHPLVHHVACRTVRVVTTPRTDVVLDGEVGTFTPLTFTAQRQALRAPEPREVSSRSR